MINPMEPGPVKQMFLRMDPHLSDQQANANVAAFISNVANQFNALYQQLLNATEQKKEEEKQNSTNL
jgi:hypothetical protein